MGRRRCGGRARARRAADQPRGAGAAARIEARGPRAASDPSCPRGCCVPSPAGSCWPRPRSAPPRSSRRNSCRTPVWKPWPVSRVRGRRRPAPGPASSIARSPRRTGRAPSSCLPTRSSARRDRRRCSSRLPASSCADRRPLNAAIALKKAEALGPARSESRFRLVLAYVAMGQREWARPELERLWPPRRRRRLSLLAGPARLRRRAVRGGGRPPEGRGDAATRRFPAPSTISASATRR